MVKKIGEIKITLVIAWLLILTSVTLGRWSGGEDSLKTGKDGEPAVIGKVKEFSRKDNIFSDILRTMVTFDNQNQEKTRLSRENKSMRIFEKYRGKIIRNISVQVLDVFGRTVYQPEKEPKTWLGNTGNMIHVKTQSWIVENKLFITPGDHIDPLRLAESERVLRQSDYIYDARIVVEPLPEIPDSVDIRVIVQDMWSISGGVSYRPASDRSEIHARDLNFMGLGNAFSGRVRLDDRLRRNWNWDGSYTMNNLFGHYISGKLFHESYFNDYRYGISVDRRFFSPFINWAGGVELSWKNGYNSVTVDSPAVPANVRYNRQDLWAGYATDWNILPRENFRRQRIYFSGRVIRTDYTRQPPYAAPYIYQKRLLYLGSAGYGYTRYFKDRFIFGLGRTEDVPTGGLLAVTMGIEDGSFWDKPYYGLTVGHSSYNSAAGYLYTGFQGGVYREAGEWRNGLFSFSLLYFTRLFQTGGIHYRHYLRAGYAYISDISLNTTGILHLNTGRVIRGFHGPDRTGNKQLVLNYEANFFPPLKFLGFKFAIIGFADFALLAPGGISLGAQKLQQGYGIGLRIKNEHLVFNTIQIMAGFYPRSVNSGSDFRFFSQKRTFYEMSQFQFGRPSVLHF